MFFILYLYNLNARRNQNLIGGLVPQPTAMNVSRHDERNLRWILDIGGVNKSLFGRAPAPPKMTRCGSSGKATTSLVELKLF